MIAGIRRKEIFIWMVTAFLLIAFFPGMAQADTILEATLSDPDQPKESGTGQGNTINTVLSAPTVAPGVNQELGTIRVTGKPGIAVPLQTGQKIKLTLPTGTAYMQPANSSNFLQYVDCPEMVDGQKNQLATQNGQPGIKLLASTPRSLTIEISHIDSNAPVMSLDFIFNHQNFSTVRVAPFVEKVEEYTANPDDNIYRLEFFQILAGMIDRLSPVTPELIEAQAEMFKDAGLLDYADFADIKTLIEAGYLRGNEANQLRPHDYISRIEAASLLGRVFPAQGSRPMFRDPIPAWAEHDINAAFASGIVSGYTDGSFRPNQLLSKGEALSLLQHSLESYSGKPGL